MAAHSKMTPVVQLVTMPSVFVSHGSPLVALQAGPYQDALAQFGRSVRPRAIVAISTHWRSGKTVSVISVKRNTTIHDFGGFPGPLYELTYNPPGDPELTSQIVRLLQENGFPAATSADRGLDHGTWIPLQLMYPEADIPIVAMSIPLEPSPEELYKIGQALAPLRGPGVMIFGSGGIVHNLQLVHLADLQAPVEPWAAEFDLWFRHLNTSRRSLWCWVQSQDREQSQPSIKASSMETSLLKASLCLRKYRWLKPTRLLNKVGADAALKRLSTLASHDRIVKPTYGMKTRF